LIDAVNDATSYCASSHVIYGAKGTEMEHVDHSGHLVCEEASSQNFFFVLNPNTIRKNPNSPKKAEDESFKSKYSSTQECSAKKGVWEGRPHTK